MGKLSLDRTGWLVQLQGRRRCVLYLSSRRKATVEKKPKLAERSVSSGGDGRWGDGEPQIKVSRRETGSRGRGDKSRSEIRDAHK